MLDGDAQGDPAAERVTHSVGLLDPEMLYQRSDVVGHRLEAHRAVDIRGAPVRLQVNGNHPPSLGKQRHDLAEHFRRAQPTSRISGSPLP